MRQNLTIAPSACLDAFTLGTVTVGGNVSVEQGAILALGCDPRWNPTGIGISPPCINFTMNICHIYFLIRDNYCYIYCRG